MRLIRLRSPLYFPVRHYQQSRELGENLLQGKISVVDSSGSRDPDSISFS